MKLSIRFIVAIVLVGVVLGCVQVQAKDLSQEKKLGFTYDLTYMTKWMSKGYSVYSEHGGVFNTVSVDLWQSGFGVAARYDMSGSSGHVLKERMDYVIYYGKTFFEDGPCDTRCNLSWTYKDYLRDHGNEVDCQEWKLSVCMPKILGEKICPKYVVFYGSPSGSGQSNANLAGWVHNFGLCSDLEIAALNNQKVQLEAMATYTDGLGAKGHAWSHATIGATTNFEMNEKLSVIPGVYYQMSMNGMNTETEDTLYAKVSLRYKF